MKLADRRKKFVVDYFYKKFNDEHSPVFISFGSERNVYPYNAYMSLFERSTNFPAGMINLVELKSGLKIYYQRPRTKRASISCKILKLDKWTKEEIKEVLDPFIKEVKDFYEVGHLLTIGRYCGWHN